MIQSNILFQRKVISSYMLATSEKSDGTALNQRAQASYKCCCESSVYNPNFRWLHIVKRAMHRFYYMKFAASTIKQLIM